MAQPDEAGEQRSGTGKSPCDGSVIARSDPFSDLRPFIKHLWESRQAMCCNIYPDEFPRGTEGKGATKDEEDEFLLRYFSASDLHMQGGRFLKQVLYSIARFNEGNVLNCAAQWASEYKISHLDPGMDAARIRQILDGYHSVSHPDSFLSRVVLVISYGLHQLRQGQNGTTASSLKDQAQTIIYVGNPPHEQSSVNGQPHHPLQLCHMIKTDFHYQDVVFQQVLAALCQINRPLLAKITSSNRNPWLVCHRLNLSNMESRFSMANLTVVVTRPASLTSRSILPVVTAARRPACMALSQCQDQ
jgi:hypothetical protein